jgi:signal transduction histidine kinase
VLKQYTERTSTAVHRLEAKNTELSEASVLLQRRSEELSLLSDLGQLVASEPRSDSLPALVVRRCVPALGDAVAVVWYGAQAVDPAVFWSPSAKSVLPSIGACRVDDFLTLAERVNAGQSVPDWADRTDGQWSAEPLRGADRQLGWLVTWQSGILADSERARLGALTQEVAGRLALALERDTLLEEAASLDALRAVDRAKSDFIATTAHELRTPLTSLQGYAELLRTEVEPSLRDRWLRILDVEAAQLGQVLDQLLDVSRLDSGRFQAQRRVFDLGDVARRAFDGFVEQAASRGHQLQLELNSSPRVYADPAHVERVLRNLISNSLKYTPEGGLIRVGVAERGTAEIEVCVQDPGLGIPPEWLARLFERFQRVDLPERASIRGTGLGLYIARQLVELNDGRIWAESDGLGKGSTFRFTLPIAPPRVRSDAKAT